MKLPRPGRVASEIRQTRPFPRPEAELAVTLMRTSDVFHHRVERALGPLGVSQEQFNALRILRGAGKAGLPTLEIGRRLISRSPNITRLLDKLVRKGFARRVRGTRDRRQALLTLTPAGERRVRACNRAVDDVLDELRCLTASENRTLVNLLDRVRSSVAIRTVFEELVSRPGREPDR